MVYLTELTQGYNHKPNPDAPVWDLEFHDYSKKWRALGRRGGWWKCRDGEDATDVERECELCHDEKKIKADRKSAVSVMPVRERYLKYPKLSKSLNDWDMYLTKLQYAKCIEAS